MGTARTWQMSTECLLRVTSRNTRSQQITSALPSKGDLSAALPISTRWAIFGKQCSAPDGFRCRPIVRDPALYDVACKHQLLCLSEIKHARTDDEVRQEMA